MKTILKIGLGGGCHWCTEAVFQAVTGVVKVEQGYISSETPYDSMSEAVIVHFSTIVDLEQLIDVHLETHASTQQHSRREDYRSAVYFFDVETERKLKSIINTLSRKRNKKYITVVSPFVAFEPSRESIQNYYKTRPDAPFCKRYIEPKLKLVSEILKS
ncbi:peptide methionine sulfoxide reductase MsrA [Nonlabens ulvanivorans]|uniref:peptide-methionine (S)-S-oxide reductase n=1 Tax=Nonlabens ulvanivorans TaxID=906888 RepID=A0A090WK76_NONUL|nr:peptide-methionine (S)-S-oxide reductase [Nonlabens ulvanivorans]GAL76598.1 peptide methionine sulfoxide reductase MsrA [Nonlabens ulvanivorans]